LARPHVLVVEDDDALRELYLELLGEAGYSVSTAVNGADGFALLELQPDVVVLDLRMPVLDGYGFLRMMRSEHLHREPGILVVSAAPDRDALAALGPLRLITKPFEPRLLLYEVGALLGSAYGS